MSKLGALLVQERLLTESDRRVIRRECMTHRGSFARSVLALGVLDEEELAALFAAKTSYRIAAKDIFEEVQESAVVMLPAHILAWLEVLPLRLQEGSIFVAMIDPTDRDAIAQIEFFSGLTVKPIIATRGQIFAGLQRFLPSINFGNSAFEEFLRNHSAQATRYASMDLKGKGASKSKGSGAGNKSTAKGGDQGDFEDDYAALGGGDDDDGNIYVEDSSQQAKAPPIDDFSDVAVDLGEGGDSLDAGAVFDPVAVDGVADLEGNVDLPLEAEEEVPAATADIENLNLEGLDDDLGSLDLSEDLAEKPVDAAVTGEPEASVEGSMDDLLAGSDDISIDGASDDLNISGELGELSAGASADEVSATDIELSADDIDLSLSLGDGVSEVVAPVSGGLEDDVPISVDPLDEEVMAAAGAESGPGEAAIHEAPTENADLLPENLEGQLDGEINDGLAMEVSDGLESLAAGDDLNLVDESKAGAIAVDDLALDAAPADDLDLLSETSTDAVASDELSLDAAPADDLDLLSETSTDAVANDDLSMDAGPADDLELLGEPGTNMVANDDLSMDAVPADDLELLGEPGTNMVANDDLSMDAVPADDLDLLGEPGTDAVASDLSRDGSLADNLEVRSEPSDESVPSNDDEVQAAVDVAPGQVEDLEMEIGDISIDAGPSDTIVGGEPAIIDDLIAAEPLTNDPIIGDDLDNLSSEPSVEGVPVKTSAPSPGLQASVHSGIAALNRAMVNMSLMMDPAKVLNRLAGAASQAGIQSGAVSVLQGEALKFGIMWSRESDRSQVKEGIPGSANGKILAAMAPSLAAEDQWFDIKSTFGNNYDAFKNSWIDQAHVPDSVMVRKRGDSYVVAFASFAGGANHDGLKQTFGEVVKAVSSRLG